MFHVSNKQTNAYSIRSFCKRASESMPPGITMESLYAGRLFYRLPHSSLSLFDHLCIRVTISFASRPVLFHTARDLETLDIPAAARSTTTNIAELLKARQLGDRKGLGHVFEVLTLLVRPWLSWPVARSLSRREARVHKKPDERGWNSLGDLWNYVRD